MLARCQAHMSAHETPSVVAALRHAVHVKRLLFVVARRPSLQPYRPSMRYAFVTTRRRGVHVCLRMLYARCKMLLAVKNAHVVANRYRQYVQDVRDGERCYRRRALSLARRVDRVRLSGGIAVCLRRASDMRVTLRYAIQR